jgi:RNA polymerase sigma-70 factor (ECF subfamily)
MPQWANNYTLPEEQSTIDEIKKIDKKINNLIKDKDEKNQELSKLHKQKRLFTACDNELEEIVEELFYGFWRDRERLPLFRSMKSYLYIAVRNQSFQYCEHQEVRNKYREFVLSRKGRTQDSNPQEEMEYQELRHLIDATLARMPERRLRIFRMHRMEGKKYAEIASQLSLSVKTVEAEMTKALKALKKEIENYIIRT